MKKTFFALLLLSSLAACKRDADDLPEERLFARDFYAQGVWQDTSVVHFDYTVGRPVELPFSNVFRCRSQAEIINGYKTIRCNFFGTSSNNELLFIRFKAPAFVQPGETAEWTRAELDVLLAPGKIFELNGEAGQAEMGMRPPANSFIPPALSALAPVSSGQLTVISVEDYRWTQRLFDGSQVERFAKKVRVQFEANLGVSDFNGNLVGQAELRNGEASLYLEYL